MALALDAGEPQVLDLMAGRAQRDHPHQRVRPAPVVVVPHLVALHRTLGAFAATELAAVAGLAVDLPAYAIPAEVVDEGVLESDQIDGRTERTAQSGTEIAKSDQDRRVYIPSTHRR